MPPDSIASPLVASSAHSSWDNKTASVKVFPGPKPLRSTSSFYPTPTLSIVETWSYFLVVPSSPGFLPTFWLFLSLLYEASGYEKTTALCPRPSSLSLSSLLTWLFVCSVPEPKSWRMQASGSVITWNIASVFPLTQLCPLFPWGVLLPLSGRWKKLGSFAVLSVPPSLPFFIPVISHFAYCIVNCAFLFKLSPFNCLGGWCLPFGSSLPLKICQISLKMQNSEIPSWKDFEQGIWLPAF